MKEEMKEENRRKTDKITRKKNEVEWGMKRRTGELFIINQVRYRIE